MNHDLDCPNRDSERLIFEVLNGTIEVILRRLKQQLFQLENFSSPTI